MKTVLVTGGAGDIGSEICRVFVHNGYNVVINYNTSEEAALALCRELGENAVAIKADISDSGQVKNLFCAAMEAFGGVDVLINNAGVSSFSCSDMISDELWEKTMAVNLNGCFFCCREALGYMIEKKSGAIINISSMWGVAGASCEVHYSASKAGVIGLTKALAKEVGPCSITVNCIAPGVIEGKMNSALSVEDIQGLKDATPLGRIGTPRDVADLALYLAGADFVTGQIIGVDGGFLL